ncbi:MAG: hypothetical protein ACXQS8_06800 [Candidatus Helarchaeales archaeon]
MAYQYKTKFLVSIIYNSQVYEIIPVETITTRMRTPKEIRDSLSQGNIQKIHQWPRYTFEIRTSAYAKNLAILYWLQNYNADFDIRIEEVIDDPDLTSDVRLRNVQLLGCSIEDIGETFLSNDVPGIVVTGVATGRTSSVDAASYEYTRNTPSSGEPTPEE